jgi:hypothetical protein
MCWRYLHCNSVCLLILARVEAAHLASELRGDDAVRGQEAVWSDVLPWPMVHVGEDADVVDVVWVFLQPHDMLR